jgi:polar amino acid transport system permease protein
MEWRWEFAIEILPRMLWATGNTLLAAGAGYAIAMVVGLILMFGQQTPYRVVNIVVRELVEFVRSTPLLVCIGRRSKDPVGSLPRPEFFYGLHLS